ncbi:MAG: hypothetical protein PHS44_03055 [Candidatus Dojkabacteria bacterium]|nr:hypothetical protein [Candidatus Dojkabacteria bacterium]
MDQKIVTNIWSDNKVTGAAKFYDYFVGKSLNNCKGILGDNSTSHTGIVHFNSC